MYYFKEDDDKLECRSCKWKGLRKEAECQRYVSSPESWHALAGRDGWIWKCPVCKFQVDSYWLRMS